MRELALALTIAAITLPGVGGVDHKAAPKAQQVAMYCTKTGEEVSGQNKICYYSCAGSTAAITVASYQVCPVGINR